MSAASSDIPKRKRSPQRGAPILVRLQPNELELLDLWIAANGGEMSRPEAMRRILKLVAVRLPK
jgi:hypothetical protein